MSTIVWMVGWLRGRRTISSPKGIIRIVICDWHYQNLPKPYSLFQNRSISPFPINSSSIFLLSQIRPFHKHPFLKPLSIVSSPQIRLPFPLLLPAHIFNPIPPLHLPSITTDRFPRYTPIHHKKNTLSIGVSLFVVSVVQRKKHSSSCRLLSIPPVSTVQILFVISTMRWRSWHYSSIRLSIVTKYESFSLLTSRANWTSIILLYLFSTAWPSCTLTPERRDASFQRIVCVTSCSMRIVLCF